MVKEITKGMRNDKPRILNEEELEQVNGAGYKTIVVTSMDPYGNLVVHEYIVWIPD